MQKKQLSDTFNIFTFLFFLNRLFHTVYKKQAAGSDTGNNAVCSGLPHFGAFDGHLSLRNMHQIAWLLRFMEETLKCSLFMY